MMSARLEFKEGSSSKFWEIEVYGSSFTTYWGRTGAVGGQSKKKSFKDSSEAMAEAEKLIKEKVKKGYFLVSSKSSSEPEINDWLINDGAKSCPTQPSVDEYMASAAQPQKIHEAVQSKSQVSKKRKPAAKEKSRSAINENQASTEVTREIDLEIIQLYSTSSDHSLYLEI